MDRRQNSLKTNQAVRLGGPNHGLWDQAVRRSLAPVFLPEMAGNPSTVAEWLFRTDAFGIPERSEGYEHRANDGPHSADGLATYRENKVVHRPPAEYSLVSLAKPRDTA
jgi:hypothetical protein